MQGDTGEIQGDIRHPLRVARLAHLGGLEHPAALQLLAAEPLVEHEEEARAVGLDAADEVALALVERGDITSISPASPYISRISRVYLAPVERGDQGVHLITELEGDAPVLRHLVN